ncbi:MAG: hypothetical protein AAB667_01645 [Patescibacteria group bacterium]
MLRFATTGGRTMMILIVLAGSLALTATGLVNSDVVRLPANIIEVQSAQAAETASASWQFSYGNVQVKLEEAKAILANKEIYAGRTIYKCTEYRNLDPNRVTPSRMDFDDRDRQIAAALLNPVTGELAYISIVRMACGVSAPAGYAIEIVSQDNGVTWNAWSTMYRIMRDGQEWSVILVNYPVARGSGKSMTIEPFLYSPYSDSWASGQEFMNGGGEYLVSVDEAARASLRKNAVMSLAVPGVPVADVIPQSFVLHRPLLEQSDLAMAIWNPEATAGRVLGILSLNHEKAFTQTVSTAAAYGMYQFTDKKVNGTYTTVKKNYPKAGLIKDFKEGAKDHVNSAKAMILLDDLNLRTLVKTFGPQIIQDPKLGEYLAAAYNGGITRVVRALRAKTWPKGDWALAMSGKGYKETQGFIAKLRVFQEAKLFGSILD